VALFNDLLKAPKRVIIHNTLLVKGLSAFLRLCYSRPIG
jgi:hypothetical protein